MKRLTNPTEADLERREAMLDRIERMTELPLMILAFAMVPLLAAPFFWELSPVWQAVALALDTFIWVVFAADLAVKTAIAPRRLQYLRQHWLDVIVVLVPFARPTRILRIIVYGSQGVSRGRSLGQRRFPESIRRWPRAHSCHYRHVGGAGPRLADSVLPGRVVVGHRNGDYGGIRGHRPRDPGGPGPSATCS